VVCETEIRIIGIGVVVRILLNEEHKEVEV